MNAFDFVSRFSRLPVAAVTAAVVLSVVSCGGSSSSSSKSAAPDPAPAPVTGASTPATAAKVDVLTYHNDIARTGQNLSETVLTPATVQSAGFGKVGFLAMDGKVDAEPLYVSGLTVAGSTHDVVYAATEHGTVYAFDAASGATLWHTSLLGAGETPSDTHGCGQITPEIGITATPVIDRTRGAAGVIYAVAMSKDSAGHYHQRLHALDLATGAETLNGPTEVAASYPGTGANSVNGRVVFDPGQYAERQALLLLNGQLYLGWTSHCDIPPYGGWVMAYSAATLGQTSALSVTPNGSEGSVWMSGAGMASDGASIYLLDANGDFGTTLNAQGFPANGNFGNSFLKLSTNNGLAVADYFATHDTVSRSAQDVDFGSGGVLLLPDQTDATGTVRHLAVGAGKDKSIYVVDRDAMGKFDPLANHVWQQLDGQLAQGVFGMPAYFGGVVYYGAVSDHIKAFPLALARLAATPSSQTPGVFAFPGATPSVSANGTSNGIVWTVENNATAVLHAYDATNLAHELYNSAQAGARDSFGAGNKFITPMIARGRVFVGTGNGVAVFGLLH